MKQRRWVCPNGCGGVLAPSRPRRNDVRRYCLACSERTGKLVERISPALEAERKRKAEAAKAKRERKAETAKRNEEAYWTVRTVDAAGKEINVHVERELRAIARRAGFGLRTVTIKRRHNWTATSGRCWEHSQRIHITTADGESWERLQYVLAHEVAHLEHHGGKSHGPEFRKSMARVGAKAWPGIGRLPAALGLSRQRDVIMERLAERTRRLAEDAAG